MIRRLELSALPPLSPTTSKEGRLETEFNHTANDLTNHAHMMRPPHKNSEMRFRELPGWWRYQCAERVACFKRAWKPWADLPRSFCPMYIFIWLFMSIIYNKPVIIHIALSWSFLVKYQTWKRIMGIPKLYRSVGSLGIWALWLVSEVGVVMWDWDP